MFSIRPFIVLAGLIVCATLAGLPQAQAKSTLRALSDGVVVYSGPGTFYRPISVLAAKQEVRSGSKKVVNSHGAFYRVLVILDDKTKAIGYVSALADIRLFNQGLDDDDLDKFGDVALIQNAAQASYSILHDGNTLYTVGYLHYLGPGFFVKAYAGHFDYASGIDTGTVGGGEIGNDALVKGPISILVSCAAGLFAPSRAGAIFLDSGSVNAMMQAVVGARYNLHGFASMSLGLTQLVFFNANNSRILNGVNLTVEVGL